MKGLFFGKSQETHANQFYFQANANQFYFC